ncbi:O-fucosyltransferase 27-like isoform X1 [Amaranthus tricolor]|uniref:O-fucosyltransferase 27-like isoform X1 n=1 Tax=Amaranthus tricolor TaxID=29722 RepID=UPI00258302E2|nr:O-fucosyltransferase 27-like isoform X1 [Amaranthus tricolor]
MVLKKMKMRWVAMKVEGKKGRMKWGGFVMILSLTIFSLFTLLLLARYTLRQSNGFDNGGYDFHPFSSFSIFAWKPIFGTSDLPRNSPLYKRLWGPIRELGSLYPHANPQGPYAAPSLQSTGFLFVRVRGGFHEIRNAISDAVAVARLLNATLVIPEILSTTSTKGISSEFKSFAYLYNEDQFMAALVKDVNIVKTLPKNLKEARRKKAVPLYKVPNSASVYFYLHQVLPMLKKHSIVELVVSDGGCLQSNLPPNLEEYQRLRCRVAFHALQFRREVQELATNILRRLRVPGKPFIAYEPGLTREALAYYGCAELFQDVHTELIQHKRSWMLKRGIINGRLSVDSAAQRLNGSCPLMPEEVGLILRAYGYRSDTVIYVSGGEIFGGQRILIPLHAMFDNVVDRTSLSTSYELTRLYGRESNSAEPPPRVRPAAVEVRKIEAWKNAGPRPRPLPPPPARPKYPYNIEGWWGWVAESDNEPDSTMMELRTNAHKLLWEAIDYIVCVEADVFIPGFDRDGKGRPNLASLVMGHRLYQSASSVTFRPNRKEVAKLIDDLRESMHPANRTWLSSIRNHLRKTLLDGPTEAFNTSKPLSFLSHPVPECSCSRGKNNPPNGFNPRVAFKIRRICPAWMGIDQNSRQKEKESDGEVYSDDGFISSFFFGRGMDNQGASNGGNGSREESQFEDQEIENGER